MSKKIIYNGISANIRLAKDRLTTDYYIRGN